MVQAGVDPVAHLLTVFLWHPGHPGDDLHRERSGEILHNIEVAGVDGAQVLVDHFDDRLVLRLNGPRRERLVEQAAHMAVLRRIHEDDRLLFGRYAPAHHRQVAASCRGVCLEVFEGRRDVFVAGQRVEVLFFVVIQRRVLAHPSIYVERVVVVVLGIRVEDELRLCH